MSSSGRRFVVFVRAGELTLHRDWLIGADRNWDLIVSWYGDTPYVPVSDEVVLVAKGWKWDVIAQQLQDRPELIEQYDYFWLPDDDIAADACRINQVFDLSASRGLSVSQPALTPDSYFSFLHTLQSPSFLLRYSTLIEVMVPCLSRDALKRALPYFAEVPSGIGLSALWTRFEADNFRKSAVLDAVTVRHTRPVGKFLLGRMKKAGEAARKDAAKLAQSFGEVRGARRFHCYEGLDRHGRHRGRWRTAAWMVIDYLGSLRGWVEKRRWRHLWRLIRSIPDRAPLSRLELLE